MVPETVGIKDRIKPYFKTRPRGPARAKPGAPGAAATQASPPPAKPAGVARPASDPQSVAGRERLAAEFNAIQLDLGGLVYEMAIRDHFRLDLLSQRAAKLHAVDVELARAEGTLTRASPTPPACPDCSTPLVVGAAFCAGCGRSLAGPAAPAPAPAAAPAPNATAPMMPAPAPATQAPAPAAPARAPAAAPPPATTPAPAPATPAPPPAPPASATVPVSASAPPAHQPVPHSPPAPGPETPGDA